MMDTKGLYVGRNKYLKDLDQSDNLKIEVIINCEGFGIPNPIKSKSDFVLKSKLIVIYFFFLFFI